MTETQANLMRRSREALAAARLLLNEGLLADAVSRAYYSMFYVATALLLGEGLEFKTHSGVVGGFGQVFAKPGRIAREFHRYLLDAQDERLESEYTATYRPDVDTAKTVIERAEQFVALGDRMLGG